MINRNVSLCKLGSLNLKRPLESVCVSLWIGLIIFTTASTGTTEFLSAETNPEISVFGTDLNWLYKVIEKVITAAMEAKMTFPLEKNATIDAFVIITGRLK